MDRRLLRHDRGVVRFNVRNRKLNVIIGHFLDGGAGKPPLSTSDLSFPVTAFTDEQDCKILIIKNCYNYKVLSLINNCSCMYLNLRSTNLMSDHYSLISQSHNK